MDYQTSEYALGFATLLGAFGGFPKPPQQMTKIVNQYPLLSWVLVFVLVWQGGGGQDVQFSVLITVLAFIIYKLLEYSSKQKLE